MNAASLLTSHDCLGLSRRALHQLRIILEQDGGIQSASVLQQAGFAAGESVYAAFNEWVQARYRLDSPRDLDVEYFGEALSGFFAEFGWGHLVPDQLSPAVVTLDSPDWAEASPEHRSAHPSCHFSCGMLADFLGRVSNAVVGVMEVECRTRGDEACRFLTGAPETLQLIYDRMSQGLPYLEAAAAEAAT